MKIFMPLPGSRASGVIAFSSFPNLEGFHCLFVYFGLAEPRDLYIADNILCHKRASIQYLLKNTTAKTIAKLGNEVR